MTPTIRGLLPPIRRWGARASAVLALLAAFGAQAEELRRWHRRQPGDAAPARRCLCRRPPGSDDQGVAQ